MPMPFEHALQASAQASGLSLAVGLAGAGLTDLPKVRPLLCVQSMYLSTSVELAKVRVN